MLEASLEGVGKEIVRDHATGEYSQICIKSNRNKTAVKSKKTTNGWLEQGIGPYANHSACTPSHICEEGTALCRACPTRGHLASLAAKCAEAGDGAAAAAAPAAKSGGGGGGGGGDGAAAAAAPVKKRSAPEEQLTRPSSKRQKGEN